MDESILQVATHEGDGYAPVIDFESWRVALLNTADQYREENLTYMERHDQTDEVFVLLKGTCVLVIGDGGDDLGEITAHLMERGVFYNVREAAWHTCALSDGTSVLIVENRDTGRHNSTYIDLSDDQKKHIVRTVKKARAGA